MREEELPFATAGITAGPALAARLGLLPPPIFRPVWSGQGPPLPKRPRVQVQVDRAHGGELPFATATGGQLPGDLHL